MHCSRALRTPSLAIIASAAASLGAPGCGDNTGDIPDEFEGVNQKGFGDYADGFVPGGMFAGCDVPDDFTHALGDPAEVRVATALAYRATGRCPPVARERIADPLAAVTGVTIPKPLWRQGMIATKPARWKH
jgi:hypothetical protein